MPLSELVLVDQHEAQGWRVRHDERLDSIFEQRCDWIREYGRAGQLAVDSAELWLTYDELDRRSSRVARYLRLHGADAGDRIALVFDRPIQTYIGALAVLKIGATCVPLDVDTPTERLAYFVTDAQVRMVLTRAQLRGRVCGVEALQTTGAELLFLDQADRLIAEMSDQRLLPAERGGQADLPAYIVYTRSPSGWPESVAIDHRSICNYVRVASEIFGIRGHRSYQGQAVACAAALEETWVAWAAGATLVPAPPGLRLRGRDLHAFLSAKRVTALCTTPAQLATLEDDLPDLRFLLVSGEACPQSLVARWYRKGRRFLNAYRPSGATVAATWTQVRPEKPVTIGVPLPTYATVLLDPDVPRRALRQGETGEIGVAGIGLSCGYLDSNDLTGSLFVEDFLGIPGNPSGRIYRTGDLGRVNEAGELEYLGRLDEQVYIDSQRVDLTTVESVLLEVPGIAAAVVTTHRPAPEVTELVGYYTVRADAPDVNEQLIRTWLGERLAPQYVPTHLERLDVFPMTPQQCVDRRSLPGPGMRRAGAAPADTPSRAELDRLCAENASLLEQLYWMPSAQPRQASGPTVPAPPADPTDSVQLIAAPAGAAPAEAGLAQVLAEVLDVERVRVDSHFFDDLGADSMVMARFCARLRKRADLPTVSIKDVYTHPTIAALAQAFAPAARTVAPAAVPARHDPVAIGLAQVLAEVLDVERVRVDSHFFDDLGGDSMVMARFCARVRKRADLPTVSIKDIYANPTIAALAVATQHVVDGVAT
ncbi:non-ribosomal peptide synthetase [Pseudonocardia sp. D17]|uniref:non-ribosomal peptide synthetase n=1 Tax=Pseudonocardia sp. D17 TaxID=882661 RepID=UPI002B3C6735|nr:hypothetical protein PSD17_45920 [Pseudonocardia sp. D17]